MDDTIPQISAKQVEEFAASAGIATEGGDPAKVLGQPAAPTAPALPPTPMEQALQPSAPAVAKQVQDSGWLDQMPDFDPQTCAPSEAEMERFVGSICLDRPFVVEVTVLGGKLPVVVQAMTSQQMEFLYAYLRAIDVSQGEFFTELRYAAAALQVLKIGGQSYSHIQVPEGLPVFIDELRHRDRILNSGQTVLISEILSKKGMDEFRGRRDAIAAGLIRRISEFRAMQHLRWTAIVTAVRMASVKNRLLSDLIVRENPVFSDPGASV